MTQRLPEKISRLRPRKHHLKKALTKKITIAKWELNAFGVVCISIGVVLGAYGVLSGFIPRILAASDITETWDFGSAGDYMVSDGNSIEVAGGQVRLKIREYQSDDHTVALYHLNDSSGSVIVDSSGQAHNGTTNGAFAAGKLHNGLDLNGSNQRGSVSDSAALSLGQTHTIEAWAKLDNALSPSSHAAKQTIVDKGDYSLYYDRGTAKLTYEMATSSGSYWTQEAGSDTKGSWDLNGKLAVTSQTTIGNNVYAGLGNAVGDAEVWQWNGTVWNMIGGDGLNGSWPDSIYESVTSLISNGTVLYAGLGSTAGDGEVWSCDMAASCASWTKLGGDGVGWPVSIIEEVKSMTVMDGHLYVGLGASNNDARLFRWDGSSWLQVGGTGIAAPYNSYGTTYNTIYSLVNDGTTLYAGMGLDSGEADVWALTDTTWTQVGGDAVNGSWDAGYEMVYSLERSGSDIYAGLGSTTGDAEVWRYSSGSWTKIGGDGAGWADSEFEVVYSLQKDGGSGVYAGLGNGQGDAEVWHWDGTAWTMVGGDATNGGFGAGYTGAMSLAFANSRLYVGLIDSNDGAELWSWTGEAWAKLGGSYVNKSWGYYNLQSVENMTVAGEYLYAGTGTTVAGNALVWRFDGSQWLIVGGQGINGSWTAQTYESVTSMASWQGNLYVGLGTSANDGEVWQWDGSSWSQIGGDSLNSGWTVNYDSVWSLAGFGGHLYAGLGSSANEAEVWQWDGSSWTKIADNGFGGAWGNSFERVFSMVQFNGLLTVGLGSSVGDGEVWQWNGSNAWTKLGGDGVNTSWNVDYEEVTSLAVLDGVLYAGLGNTAGDSEVWQWNGSNAWTKIGGDELNSSWSDGQYEMVRSMVAYNGQLHIALGSGTGDGEVWQWNGTSWTRIAGSGVNDGWSSAVETASALTVYRGSLMAGTGQSGNVDAAVWSWGHNAYLQSSVVGVDTDWHHVAATYDGATVKLYIDGNEVASQAVLQTLPDGDLPLLLGSSYGSMSFDSGGVEGFWEGLLDEVRISSVARNSFNIYPYSTSAQTVRPATAVQTSGVLSWDSFEVAANLDGGTATYRVSDNGGASWKYWDGSQWVASEGLNQANSQTVLADNLATLQPNSQGFLWQAILYGDGSQRPTISSVEMRATSDTTEPTNPDTIQVLDSQEGSIAIATNDWHNYDEPYFSWSGAADNGSGLAGYYVYFGTDQTADPVTAGTFQTEAYYSGQDLSSGSTYYLRIKARDVANNTASSAWAPFNYKYDATAPTNPGVVSASPSGYTNVNNFTFVWPTTGGAAATDTSSGLAGYQYKTGASSGPLSDWSETVTEGSVTISEAAYQEGVNTFSLRTIDNAGNINSLAVQTNYYYAGNAPTAPTNVQVNPASNTQNSFGFNWSLPAAYTGQSSKLTYCYTVNTLPSPATCAFTGFNVTALSADAYATQPGDNTFYVVARDETGNISYGAYGQVTFNSQTTAPGAPQNQDISDVSVKSTQSWKVALAWEAPNSGAQSVANYQIYHSLNGASYTRKASTTGIAFVDTGLSQELHYYKIRACDSTNNCGAFSPAVSLIPDGKYTEAAELTSKPEVSNITTKQAIISWATDRASDSKIAFGLAPNSYYPEEPSMPSQVTNHKVSLSNLSPGTTYYYKVKWTDEDGNTGMSEEFQLTTAPAPTISDPKAKSVSLNTAALEYTAKGASSVKIYYGTTAGFGGLKESQTSTVESTYVTVLDGLQDGTKYFYKISAVDTEGSEYSGNTLTFTTVAKPKISEVRLQQLPDSAQPSVEVTWSTNTETSSIVSYYPSDRPAESRDEVAVALVSGPHKLILRGLLPQTEYVLIVKGRDRMGNEAESDPQRFTTSTDTRPAKISDIKIEGSKSQGANKQAQLVISWNTDEPTTSQIEFGDGAGNTYSQKTQEDSNLTTNHLVVIPGLSPSKVYHLRVISKDAAGNISTSVDMATITPKAADDAFSLVLANLSEVFGFLNILNQ